MAPGKEGHIFRRAFLAGLAGGAPAFACLDTIGFVRLADGVLEKPGRAECTLDFETLGVENA